ncbi:MAG TPA: hypothetical protein VD862_04835 [Candidatus Paceibacterota bacterium]|nr:hypothetical protein [Candidatus Paceibacterota bacterium]
MRYEIPDHTVAIVDAVQAVCRDKRIRMPFKSGLDVLALLGDLTGSVAVTNEKDWGKGSVLTFGLFRGDRNVAWTARGPATFRFGRTILVPLNMQERSVDFDIVPVYASPRDDRLWRPARYSIRNMKYTGRHVEGIAAQTVR